MSQFRSEWTVTASDFGGLGNWTCKGMQLLASRQAVGKHKYAVAAVLPIGAERSKGLTISISVSICIRQGYAQAFREGVSLVQKKEKSTAVDVMHIN